MKLKVIASVLIILYFICLVYGAVITLRGLELFGFIFSDALGHGTILLAIWRK